LKVEKAAIVQFGVWDAVPCRIDGLASVLVGAVSHPFGSRWIPPTSWFPSALAVLRCQSGNLLMTLIQQEQLLYIEYRCQHYDNDCRIGCKSLDVNTFSIVASPISHPIDNLFLGRRGTSNISILSFKVGFWLLGAG